MGVSLQPVRFGIASRPLAAAGIDRQGHSPGIFLTPALPAREP